MKILLNNPQIILNICIYKYKKDIYYLEQLLEQLKFMRKHLEVRI